MRIACIALVLSFVLSPAGAFEIEAKRSYPSVEEGSMLSIISTADVEVFEPIIFEFQKRNPDIAIDYVVASSSEVMRALHDENASYDLGISSAMDLQTKLANDGFTMRYVSDATSLLPDWATWRDRVFAFTQERAVLVISESTFEDLPIPNNREDLIELLREYPEIFDGRIGTYDVRTSGTGYLFATQDSRNTESFWRLTEVMGRLNTKLYCCSGAMLADVASGKLAFAYNVLDSYANSKLGDTPGIVTVEMDDFVSVMLRTAIIPNTVKNFEAAGTMIDFLAELGNYPELVEQTGLPPVEARDSYDSQSVRPIRLGPGLMVFLDKMRKESFLRSWVNSIEQR
ncbi:MAG: ABC transporter substrate-binding protein [Pseudomonadota bacterium]